MLKLNQTVLLPIHETIGKVIDVNTSRAIIRVSNEKEVYDVLVTPNGNLPHTNCSIVEPLAFTENEFAFIERGNGLVIGQISNLRVEQQTVVCDFTVYRETETIEKLSGQPTNELHKLFGLYKKIIKMVKANDKFKRDEMEPSIKTKTELQIHNTFLNGSND